MNLVLNKKLVLLFLAFLILFPISLFLLREITPQPIKNSIPTPVPQISPTIQTLPEDDPQKDRLEYVQTKKTLSVEDEQVKFEILSTLGGSQSQVLYTSSNVIIDYVRSADIFQAEILTTNIDFAKSEATSWFKKQGLSDEGICNLPLSFYLNFDIKTQLGENTTSFDPLPPGCYDTGI